MPATSRTALSGSLSNGAPVWCRADPDKLSGMSLLFLLACDSLTDADRYSRALVASADYETARHECRQIAEPSLAGDCLVASMERWQALGAEDCAAIASALWQDECFFLLAERQWKGGMQTEGLGTCRKTRFARACTWHLIQDEAEAAAAEAPEVAEARLLPFIESGAAPDAGMHFWKLWLRARSVDGTAVDERDCDQLKHSRPCREAVGRYVHEVLEASARQDRDGVCSAAPGQRVLMRGHVAWSPGPLVEVAEQQWVDRYCR